MTTHVFIVNAETFKYHLEYMFVGTGAKDDDIDFISSMESTIKSNAEKKLVGMIADISRIRIGDEIIFYLTGCAKFYGIFKVKELPFLDDNGEFLLTELGKKLTFRAIIEPAEVYSEGVPEDEALDYLDKIDKPYEMCWSLIYRKLKGNRGCTAIFDYEAERLKSLIKEKNGNIKLTGSYFLYDNEKDKIIKETESFKEYEGKQNTLDILERLIYKSHRNNAFEVHLQAYIMKNIENIFPYINLNVNDNKIWFSNEVACGVGMRKIDIMIIAESNTKCNINIIELKYDRPKEKIIIWQLPRYIKWCEDYVIPNYATKEISINPIILAKKFKKSSETLEYKDIALKNPVTSTCATVNPTKFISFNIEDKDIKFKNEF